MHKKRGQVSVFVIIGIVIFVGVIAFFLINGNLKQGEIPEKFQPIADYFLTCVQENAEVGARILGQQGGYIYPPKFEVGSEFKMFSNQLDFFGTPVPYWYYSSGNNLIKEQIPSVSDMEEQLEQYIEENMIFCDFRDFEAEGFEVLVDDAQASVDIKEGVIEVSLDEDLDMTYFEESATKSAHETQVASSLGKFYTEAKKIYDYEKKQAFLETYAVDVLRLYAPVDGVEFDCSPLIWNKQEIQNELKAGLEANTQAIKLKGDYYELKNKENEYFVVDLDTSEAINFLYSPSWPTRIEISGEKESIENEAAVLVAKPIGSQPGLAAMGFCYVPYHFVYDIDYPVLIQIYNNDELFQFPVAVIIDDNVPRQSLAVSSLEEGENICDYKNERVSVSVYDIDFNPIEASLSFECLNQRCELGETGKTDEAFETLIPQCVNGKIIAEASGYSSGSALISSNVENDVAIVLDRIYDVDVELRVDGEITNDFAIISFESGTNAATLAWPDKNSIKLSEELYNISVSVYKNGSVYVPETKNTQCIDVPKPGLSGLFGGTSEQCYDLVIPSQTISNVVYAGGKTVEYLFEEDLEKKIIIDVQSVKTPTNLDELQKNYDLVENNYARVEIV